MLLTVFISLILVLVVVPSSSYQSIFSSINLYNKHSISSTSLYSTIDAVSEFGLTPTLNKYVTGTD